MKYLIRFAFSLMLLHLLSGALFATTPDEIQSAIEARYKVTTRSFLGRIKEIGTILVIQKEGLRADVPKALMKATVIMNRKIAAVGGGNVFGIGNTGHALKIGDRLHLYRVNPKDEYIDLIIATVDTFDVVKSGSTESKPYKALVRFRYDGGLSTVSTKQILEDINAWFKTEEEAMSTKTIQLGQTLDEVIAIFGTPEKTIDLKRKVVLVYKDMKVVFIDGKVADVQ